MMFQKRKQDAGWEQYEWCAGAGSTPDLKDTHLFCCPEVVWLKVETET